jgi:hypothetical protein
MLAFDSPHQPSRSKRWSSGSSSRDESTFLSVACLELAPVPSLKSYPR